jgi:hypothetical protein
VKRHGALSHNNDCMAIAPDGYSASNFAGSANNHNICGNAHPSCSYCSTLFLPVRFAYSASKNADCGSAYGGHPTAEGGLVEPPQHTMF